MGGSDVADAEKSLRAAIGALDRACADAAAALDAIPDPQDALSRAKPLADLLDETARRLASLGAKLRARQAWRIWKNDELSLAQLANRLGVSRQRAGRMLDKVNDEPEEERP